MHKRMLINWTFKSHITKLKGLHFQIFAASAMGTSNYQAVAMLPDLAASIEAQEKFQTACESLVIFVLCEQRRMHQREIGHMAIMKAVANVGYSAIANK